MKVTIYDNGGKIVDRYTVITKNRIGKSLINSDKPELQWVIIKRSKQNVTLGLKKSTIKKLVSTFSCYKNKYPSVAIVTTIVQNIVNGSSQMQINKINKRVEKHYKLLKEIEIRQRKLSPVERSLVNLMILDNMFDEVYKKGKIVLVKKKIT